MYKFIEKDFTAAALPLNLSFNEDLLEADLSHFARNFVMLERSDIARRFIPLKRHTEESKKHRLERMRENVTTKFLTFVIWHMSAETTPEEGVLVFPNHRTKTINSIGKDHECSGHRRITNYFMFTDLKYVSTIHSPFKEVVEFFNEYVERSKRFYHSRTFGEHVRNERKLRGQIVPTDMY